jgi:hypothetical protein
LETQKKSNTKVLKFRKDSRGQFTEKKGLWRVHKVVYEAGTSYIVNDIMMKGLKVQEDLFNILLRFRSYKYVITADIKQMYQQIKVAEENRALQLIVWRFKPTDPIKYYQLNTVTFAQMQRRI